MIAPIFAIVSSCLSDTTFASSLRCSASLPSSLWSVDCISTIDMPMSAPWRTMSTESESIGVRRSIASRSPVPAHEIPTAIVAPYRTCGL